MDQDFNLTGTGKAQGVPAVGHLGDLAVHRGVYLPLHRLNAAALAQNALTEHRVRYLIHFQDLALGTGGHSNRPFDRFRRFRSGCALFKFIKQSHNNRLLYL